MSRSLKKIAIVVAAFLLVLGSLPFLGLTNAKAADSSMVNKDKITIGTLKNTAAIPATMAKDNSEFNRNNVDADTKAYDSNTELNEDIKNGEVNFATTDLVNYAALVKANPSWKIIGTLPGYYGLVANKSIKSVKSLKGKTIAIDKKDSTKQYLNSLLKKNKMKFSSVKIKQIDSDSARVDALKSGEINAAVVSDPSISNAKGNGAKILNRQKINADNGQVLIANTKVTKKNTAATQIIVSTMDTEIKNMDKMAGYGVAGAALRDFGINDKGAKDITKLDVNFKKIHKVKKSDFNKAFKYAKSQKLYKGKISYKANTLKVKGVK